MHYIVVHGTSFKRRGNSTISLACANCNVAANTDANALEEFPETKRVNPGLGEDRLEEALPRNDKDEGSMASENPDPLDQ